MSGMEKSNRVSAGQRNGFTLIELLIVVAIIAILAAIAVPNFLEAQMRAKVTRTKSDFRTLSVGLESYAVDQNQYPWYDNPKSGVPAQYWSVGYRLRQLTTPIAYVSSVDLLDPFISQGVGGGYSDGWPRNQYNYRSNAAKQFGMPYKSWVLNSLGPDKLKQQGLMIEQLARGQNTGTIIYDPTNGTVSAGDIPWTGGDTMYRNK